MLPQHCSLDEISYEDILKLVEVAAPERKWMELKSQLPNWKDNISVQKFLDNIASLANTEGGDIIFGISEIDGRASEVIGLKGLIEDSEILRISQLCDQWIDPRILTINAKSFTKDSLDPVLVVRVGKSWISPHMDTYNGKQSFHYRSEKGKAPLDMDGIRRLVLRSSEMLERVRSFRDKRLELIRGQRVPVQIGPWPTIVLHIIPLDMSSTLQAVDVTMVGKDPKRLPPLGIGSQGGRYNLDGYMTFDLDQSGRWKSAYTQIFRNGAIEAVDVDKIILSHDKCSFINVDQVADKITEVSRIYLNSMKELRVNPPLVFYLSILRVRTFSVTQKSVKHQDISDRNMLDRDELWLSEAIMNSYDEDIIRIFQPVFDELCQAGGYERSYEYERRLEH
jgi:hypothetical protein